MPKKSCWQKALKTSIFNKLLFLLSSPRKQKLVLFLSIATMLMRNLGLFIFSLLSDVMNSKMAQLF